MVFAQSSQTPNKQKNQKPVRSIKIQEMLSGIDHAFQAVTASPPGGNFLITWRKFAAELL